MLFKLDVGYAPPLPLDFMQTSSGHRPMNQQKLYKAANLSNDCNVFWELPEISSMIPRMNKRLRLISHNTQSTLPSPPG
jgi:hypothetical protein